MSVSLSWLIKFVLPSLSHKHIHWSVLVAYKSLFIWHLDVWQPVDKNNFSACLFSYVCFCICILPKGRRVKRCSPGCELSKIIFLVLLRQQDLAMSSSEGLVAADVFCAILITLCRTFLSAAVEPACLTVIQYVGMLSIWRVRRKSSAIGLPDFSARPRGNGVSFKPF